MRQIEQNTKTAIPGIHSPWYVEAMEHLIEVGQELSQSHNIDSIVSVVRDAARELTGADGATFILRENDNCFYVEENAIAPLWKGRRFPMSNCVSGWVMLNKTPAVIEDIYSDPRVPHDAYRQTFVKSMVMVPIRRDSPVGAIGNYWAQQKRASDEELTVLQMLANMTAISIENVNLYTKLKEADRRKDEFLATLAHELRNPIAPIQNALMILQSKSTTPDLRHKAEEIMGHQLKQVVRLVDDLLDASRITHGKIELRRDIVDLNDIVNRAIETVKDSAEQKHHKINVSLPQEKILLNADAPRIAQVFSNILSNAVKYTRNGGTIDFSARVEDDTLVAAIRDDGIGIPHDEISFIFDIFTQVDNSLARAQGGLGIGLSLVRKLVELHGGTVSAHSDGPDQGSSFTVRLPIIETNQSVIDARMSEGLNAGKQLSRVLVVDNIEESAKTMGWMMEALGYDVRVEYNGKAALRAGIEFLPDFVLLDIGMPGMDGYEVCKAMSRLPEMQNTVFIAQTGWGDDKHRKMSQEAGFKFHLVKPVDMQVLQKLLQAHNK